MRALSLRAISTRSELVALSRRALSLAILRAGSGGGRFLCGVRCYPRVTISSGTKESHSTDCRARTILPARASGWYQGKRPFVPSRANPVNVAASPQATGIYPRCEIFGRVAEWSNAPVLKTGVPQGTGGSNPSPTASRVRLARSLVVTHLDWRATPATALGARRKNAPATNRRSVLPRSCRARGRGPSADDS